MRRLAAASTLRARLLGLMLLAALPALGLAAFGIYGHARALLQDAAGALAEERDRAVARQLATVAMAEALLGAADLSPPRLHDSCAALAEAGRRAGFGVAMADGAGAPLCDAPAAGPAPAGRDGVRRGPTGGLLVTRALPGGTGLATLELPLPAPRAGATLWLAETGAAPFVPPPPPGGPPAEAQGPDGALWLAASAEVAPGLLLLVARPTAPLRREAALLALRHIGEILAALGLAGLAVHLGAERAVTRPLAQLRAAVARWRAGAPLEIERPEHLPEELRDLAAAFRDGAAALAARDAALNATSARAELLAEEVHHRVKNNLQIVSSLLALQAGRVSDPGARAELEATRDRVGALATLHRHMYVHHDPEAIDIGAFLQELGAQLFAAVGERPGRRIALLVEAPPMRIASDQAVPLALLITEAVSAALKHGFPGARRGRIAIRLAATERRARLSIEDDGVWPRAEDRLGASLMGGFARQLGGELRAERPGLLELDLPLRPPLPRARIGGRA